MAKILSLLLWSAVFCGALLIIDQLFVHVPMSAPGFHESRRFYLDFRARVIALRAPAPPAPSIEAIIEQHAAPAVVVPPPAPSAAPDPAPAALSPPPVVKPPVPPPTAKPLPKTQVAARTTAAPVVAPRPSAAPAAKASGYFYADEHGELQFVDRLDQVPKRYRSGAQPLAN